MSEFEGRVKIGGFVIRQLIRIGNNLDKLDDADTAQFESLKNSQVGDMIRAEDLTFINQTSGRFG